MCRGGGQERRGGTHARKQTRTQAQTQAQAQTQTQAQTRVRQSSSIPFFSALPPLLLHNTGTAAATSLTFSRDVLAVCELENVLLAVNHLQGAVVKDLKTHTKHTSMRKHERLKDKIGFPELPPRAHMDTRTPTSTDTNTSYDFYYDASHADLLSHQQDLS